MATIGAGVEVTHPGQHKTSHQGLNSGEGEKYSSLCPEKKNQNNLGQGVKMRYCFYYTVLMLRH